MQQTGTDVDNLDDDYSQVDDNQACVVSRDTILDSKGTRHTIFNIHTCSWRRQNSRVHWVSFSMAYPFPQFSVGN